MWRFLVIMILTLVASCADTPGREASANSESECPAWKVEVVDDGRIYCVDRESLVDCPDWSVPVEVDGRFYCVDRRAFEDPD